jgi:small-conductance mechanosensitive channel
MTLPVVAGWWSDLWNREGIGTLVRAALLIFAGLPLLFVASAVIGRSLRRRVSPQGSMLIRKGLLYIGGLVLILSALYQLGFELTALLGAAGIVGIAIGFASQTSVSNIISGLFMISEKPFAVDDIIQVGDTVGIVLSIDLLAVKLRTFDNRFVRIPNETLIKTEVINITRYPIRRLDIRLAVGYKEDLQTVRDVLTAIATENPHSLDEPEPLILLTNFGERGMELLFGVWFARAEFLTIRNTIMQQIKERFEARGIEISVPHRSLQVGQALPVHLVESPDGPQQADPEA